MNLYKFAWGNNPKRATLKGRLCRKITTGRMRSVLVEFLDTGQREIVSARSLRRCEDILNLHKKCACTECRCAPPASGECQCKS